MDQTVTIFHNPACTTSRKTLELIRSQSREPVVVEYLKTGWTRPQLEALFARMGVTPREIMRVNGSPAAELGLTAPQASDDAILDAMLAHPILVNRPIVETTKGAKLCRPVETVLDLL
jgi:arsenate reductase (glutaredoxin)